MTGPRTQYLFTGFTHTAGFRVFAFEGVTDRRVRTAYSVSADLTLVRKHGIRVQELPLLCRAILIKRSEYDDRCAFTFTDCDMTVHASLVRATTELLKRKTPRRSGDAQPPNC